MPAVSLFSPRDLLGPSPLLKGLCMWGLGAGYCVAAWHVNQAAPMLGLALMGLAPFVNLFCFFRGLTCLRRAYLRWRTVRVATRLGLSPTWGDGRAGFFLVDEAKGFCVLNGLPLPFAEVDGLKLVSTFMAHTLEFERRKASPREARFVIGFADAATLRAATTRLHEALCRLTSRDIPLCEEDDSRH